MKYASVRALELLSGYRKLTSIFRYTHLNHCDTLSAESGGAVTHLMRTELFVAYIPVATTTTRETRNINGTDLRHTQRSYN